ncbi:DoxX family membrane protein [Alphaproteobacteria bacterium GH1-50]|uniref:DoxX family membrane protein n=1 Tax=Kangsaoukella pontilimi TaxID=2691042 RepID=A0A7C9IEH7_9RHOB|nr:DoxX family protein [Kangsaoukella pontilimi]MXQ06629.1 DoxX family membrane protein [Kangsaoukella pontilimi]
MIQNMPLTLLRAGLTLAFLYFGLTKLLGTPSAVALYEALGMGQWIRYVTGSVETLGAVALWVPGAQALAALALTLTMVLAIFAMLVFIGGAWWHLALLLVLSALAAYAYRGQLAALVSRA